MFSIAVLSETELIVVIHRSIHRFISKPDEFIDSYSFVFSLDRNRVEFSEVEVVSDELPCSLGYDDMDAVFFPRSFKSRGEIDCISENRVIKSIFGSDISHHDITGRKTNTEVDFLDSTSFEFGIELWERLPHEQCCLTRTNRMIFHREWRPKKSHHRVPDVFIESASLFCEDISHT